MQQSEFLLIGAIFKALVIIGNVFVDMHKNINSCRLTWVFLAFCALIIQCFALGH